MKASLNNNRKGRLEHQPLGSWFKSLLCGLSYKIRVNTFSLLTAGSFAILGAHVPGTDLDSRTITMKGQFRVPKTRQTRKSVVLVQRGKDCDSGRVFGSREGGCQAKGPCIPTTSPRSLFPPLFLCPLCWSFLQLLQLSCRIAVTFSTMPRGDTCIPPGDYFAHAG